MTTVAIPAELARHLSWKCRAGWPSHHTACGGRRVETGRRVACECTCHAGMTRTPQRVRTCMLTDKGRQAIAGLPRDEILGFGLGPRPARSWVPTEKGRAAVAAMGGAS